MPKILCRGCGKQFDERYKIYICEDCSRPFCKACSKLHNSSDAIDDDGDIDFEELDSKEVETCEKCDRLAEVLYECGCCGDSFCKKCIKKHMIKCDKPDFDEITYKEYVQEKIIEELDSVEKKNDN